MEGVVSNLAYVLIILFSQCFEHERVSWRPCTVEYEEFATEEACEARAGELYKAKALIWKLHSPLVSMPSFSHACHTVEAWAEWQEHHKDQ
jgi:hypothetical protein